LLAIPDSIRNDCICSADHLGMMRAERDACLIQVLTRTPASRAFDFMRNSSLVDILMRKILSRLTLAFGRPPLFFPSRVVPFVIIENYPLMLIEVLNFSLFATIGSKKQVCPVPEASGVFVVTKTQTCFL
jgi:hypothetical protein